MPSEPGSGDSGSTISASNETLNLIQGKVQGDRKKVSAEVEAEGFWEKAVKKMDTPLASKLSRAEFKLSGDELKIILNGGDSLFADSIGQNLEVIEKIFSEEIGTKVTVTIETVKEKRITKKDLREKVMGEPVIKEALELFEGRIADVIPITEQRGQNTGG
jgi:hypothetical protein